MESRTCAICAKQEAKYCCPACQTRTCSLPCVKEHKITTKCPGLKAAPSAPEATTSYSEQDFVKDYSFLENVNSFTEKKREKKTKIVDKRSQEAQKIKKIAKLDEYNLLPESFTRSKQNQTRIVKYHAKKTIQSEDQTPDSASTRTVQISWSVAFQEKDSKNDPILLHNILDTVSLQSLLLEANIANVKSLFLKEESTKERANVSEISSERWNDSLYSLLQNKKIIEYPVFIYELE